MAFFRGVNKFKHLEIVPGGAILGIDPFKLGIGTTYYVDRLGSDAVKGINPNEPLKTMTAAIAKCKNNIGDAVVVMQESPSTPTTGEVWPVVIDKGGVLLTGLYSRGLISDSGFGSAGTNKDCIQINANHVTVENLYLQVASGATAKSVVTTGLAPGSGVYGFTLRNCWLGLQTVSLYGLYSGDSVDWPYLLIEGCTFSAPNADNMTNAIRLFNATFSIIRRNLFLNCSSYAVYPLGSCGNLSILDNKFQLSADTAGFAIQLADGSSRIFVDGNHAASQDSATEVAVFTDASTAGYNQWGLNYAGIVAVLGT